MAYFQILRGLRGCYMPDESSVIKCDTRRELKQHLEGERRHLEAFGLDAKAIAWASAKAWRERRTLSQLAILPFGFERGARPYSIEIHGATREEFMAQEEGL